MSEIKKQDMPAAYPVPEKIEKDYLLKSLNNNFFYLDYTEKSLLNQDNSKILSLMKNNPVTVLKEKSLKYNEDYLYICFDTEYYYENDKRYILCYSVSAMYQGNVKVFILFPKTERLLSFADLQELLSDSLGLPCMYNNRAKIKKSVPVYLIAHNLNADIKTILEFNEFCFGLIDSTGIFSCIPFKVKNFDKKSHNKCYCWSVLFRDTLCFHQTSLYEIGEGLKLTKLCDSFNDYDYDIEHMNETLVNQTETFILYAIRDTEILIEWVRQCFNGLKIPFSAPEFGALLFIQQCFGDDKAALEKWKGNKIVKRRNFNPKTNKRSTESMSKPLNPTAREIQDYARLCYHGGFNASILQGFYDFLTWDYDLQNAYSTAKVMIPEIDFDNPDLLASFTQGALITKEHSHLFPYNAIGFGRVSVTFPDNIYFPCVPVDTEYGLIFPRNVENEVVDWCTLKLAIEMGATVKAHNFNIYPLTKDDDGNVIYRLATFEKMMVESRNDFKIKFGKKSIQEVMIKLADNGFYGKTAQAVQDKTISDLRCLKNGDDKRIDLRESKVSNPYVSCYTASIIRSMLIGTMQNLYDKGYKCFSVTTDGFISNAPFDVLNSCECYGLRKMFEMARFFLTGNNGIWETKHTQECLLNIATRINIGFDKEGNHKAKTMVQAHSGYKNLNSTDKDNLGELFLHDYLNRNHKGVVVENKQFTTLKEQITGEDFKVQKKITRPKMNFDLKRCIDTDSIKEVKLPYKGTVYKVLNFASKPYNSIDNFMESKLKDVEMNTSIISIEDLERYINYDKKKNTRQKEAKQALNVLRLDERYKKDNRYKDYILHFGLASLLKLITHIFECNECTVKVTEDTWKNASRKSRYNPGYQTELTYKIVDEILEECNKVITEFATTGYGSQY